MQHMWIRCLWFNTSINQQNILLAHTKQTSGCKMTNINQYEYEQKLRESLAKDVDRFVKMFKNKKDIEIAKKIIRGQA